MKANELRIGNWLRSASSTKPGSPPRYFEVNADDIVTISEGHSLAQPIPLAPEILEMAGFAPYANQKRGKIFSLGERIGSFNIHFFKNGRIDIYGSLYFGAKDSTIITLDHCKFTSLHQLQNLYFALTATELEINLNKEK